MGMGGVYQFFSDGQLQARADKLKANRLLTVRRSLKTVH
jgi:hypothetical protein